MGDNLKLLEQKIEQVLSLVDRLKNQNAELQQENSDLQAKLTEIKRLKRNLKLSYSDQSDGIKTKLHSVLSRVEELEELKL
jgi:FtsZ-binding cell division protein ZapB